MQKNIFLKSCNCFCAYSESQKQLLKLSLSGQTYSAAFMLHLYIAYCTLKKKLKTKKNMRNRDSLSHPAAGQP